MGAPRTITDADLLDYVEGRMPAAERAAMALSLAENPGLAARLAALRERIASLRLLRTVLTPDRLPDGWMDLLGRLSRR